jgi:asparaginyl-tRNA synthetase
MALAESMIKYLTTYAMDHCAEDLSLFARFVDPQLMHRLASLVEQPFVRIPYAEAIAILLGCGQTFDYPVASGHDLQAEHERYLVEHHFKRPVTVYDFPKTIKPFYMRLNDDGQTVSSMDVLVAGIGEIIGGSQREERYDRLLERLQGLGLSRESYWWYLESRQFGSVPHSGFGLGFERLVMMMTGISNIRDVIAFPRTPKNIDF